MRIVLIAATAMVLGVSGAQAANVALLNQTGFFHQHHVLQIGNGDNYNDTVQRGALNSSVDLQVGIDLGAGAYNGSETRQHGLLNNSNVNQLAISGENLARTRQRGILNNSQTNQLAIGGLNASDTRQVGLFNQSQTNQGALFGGENYSSTSQTGVFNQSQTNQLAVGDGFNYSSTSQSGFGNVSTVTQIGF